MSSTSENTSAKFETGNPLPACPDSPNCERETRIFALEISAVKEASKKVLKEMRAETIEEHDTADLHAVFRIPVFGFRDDVLLSFSPASEDGKTAVHIRSASRTGYSDFGVNKRRVNDFYQRLQKELEKTK
ncbi:MAG: DUF1499 domain-containing protein [Balneolales bacterium]|nr:DUF1499 domain-containing protein [Balneolales bacterium]